MIIPFKSKKPSVEESCFIAPDATIVGEVYTKPQSSIWYQSVIRADLAPITIGVGTNIQELSSIHVKENGPVQIGDYVTVGHNVVLHGCTIGNYSLIGMGSILLDNVVVGNHCLVGAGSLLTEGKQFPDGSLILGSPARVVRSLTEEEIKKLEESAYHYIQLAKDNHNSIVGE